MEVNQKDFRRGPEGTIRVNRAAPVEPRPELDEKVAYDSSLPEMPARSVRRSSKGPWILLLTIVIVLAVVGFIFRDKLFMGKASVGKANFQAVFLTNGQVYFGKMSDSGSRYVTLDNIYYLQVTPVLQTGTEGQPGAGQQQQQQQQQLSLVKLGNELHGPVDQMHINRDQILFIEDLKEDGRVVQAIKDYETGQQK
ncbi:MAG: hypothetical protein M1275_03925 [Patescibacteria group bacterium]|nr:hypothetical protein [Patescibacteria group bacterium]